jgi:hypothetical protein
MGQRVGQRPITFLYKDGPTSRPFVFVTAKPAMEDEVSCGRQHPKCGMIQLHTC